MKGSNTITSLMLRDHGKIIKLLNNLKKSIKEDPNELILKSFDKFEWELERHMFVEERIIFKADLSLSRETYELVQVILDDHQVLSEMLMVIEKSLKDKNYEINLNKLERFLMDHRNREDRDFYPRLDDELDKSLKKFMVEQLKTRIF